jgi:hypothetical protein
MRWADPPTEPTSIRELTTRESSPLPERIISDERLEGIEVVAGLFWALALTFMAVCIVGAIVLLYLALFS